MSTPYILGKITTLPEQPSTGKINYGGLRVANSQVMDGVEGYGGFMT